MNDSHQRTIYAEEIAATITSFLRGMDRIGATVSVIEVNEETFEEMKASPISDVRYPKSMFAQVWFAGTEIKKASK